MEIEPFTSHMERALHKATYSRLEQNTYIAPTLILTGGYGIIVLWCFISWLSIVDD